MHDLCEGIIPVILEQILTSIVSNYSFGSSSSRQSKSASKSIIEKAFTDFKFYEGQPQLVWQGQKSSFKIDGSAVQVNKLKLL